MENNDLKVNETSSNGLMEFLTELGKALTASGISVVDITSILEKIAQAYNEKAEILVFPTMLLLKIGEQESAPLNAAIQKPGLLPLNQVSEIYDLIYKAEAGKISPIEGKKCLRKILSEKHKFGPLGILFGYILFSMGIGMLLQPTPEQLVVSGVLGAIVGILLIFSRGRNRFLLILPVVAALIVTSLSIWGVKSGLVTGSVAMLLPALAYFLPGATLTTGMFELAYGEIISGASRVIYGTAILFLILFGVLVGIQITGISQQNFLVTNPLNALGWWAPYLGVFIFAMGMYLFMSIKNKDLPWVILILYIAFFGQQAGNYLVGGVFGAFSGSLLMTISGTIIERLDHKTPSIVSIMPAFWILVPGALGFMSLATLVSQNYFTAITDGIMVAMTIVAISLGLLIGAVITEPLKEMEII
ncbi:threonine/serine ThrE exporter family protein [Methanobacterium spitsbergense]|uniref:Threonine/serine exporter family protein n=1 Tax=Methanobacterium spitsbergense TaxID=2874285 RepID=A0A8T5UVF7_9EURY|nr:threonine/serine exporter family protein [Methanobacterium spitsbergense]MBZ2164639.1 threonine/serine exporter family protein [Methanobacterium spitsbergense]